MAILLWTANSTVLSASGWPQWEAYKTRFIQADGRVVEHSQKARTTSESQAYSLFHSLVANDRKTFDKVLQWSIDNLAGGNLEQHLPAWLWGKNKNGQWKILDSNSASDADLWLAFTLLEAGRHWHSPRYSQLGKAVLQRIEAMETAYLPGLGPMVLPAPSGFDLGKDKWKLNLSYLPLQLIHRFIKEGNPILWRGVLQSTVSLLEQSASNGIVPDWIIYEQGLKIRSDNKQSPTDRIGYDAIRVYLWAGMLADDDPLKKTITRTLSTDCTRSIVKTANPAGFNTALAPLLKATRQYDCLNQLRKTVNHAWKDNLLGSPALYYNQNLSLFALGWLERRFTFTRDGNLILQNHHEFD